MIFPSKPVEKDYFQRYFGITEEIPQTFYLNTWDSNKTKVAKIEADLFKSDVYKILAYNNKLPVTESVILSDKTSMTYDYYHKHTKPKPNATKGWVCEICGFVYDGEEVPEDYICPLCKHGKEAFKKI